jgi:hypothetical protein
MPATSGGRGESGAVMDEILKLHLYGRECDRSWFQVLFEGPWVILATFAMKRGQAEP